MKKSIKMVIIAWAFWTWLVMCIWGITVDKGHISDSTYIVGMLSGAVITALQYIIKSFRSK